MEIALLEDLWSSNEPRKLLNFFSKVKTPYEAFLFASERKKSEPVIDFNNNYSKICFVIPTKNTELFKKSDYWKTVSNYDVVVTESNGRYFNYAKSVNSGINEALKGDYDWIIISNDDMQDFGLKGTIETVLAKQSSRDMIYLSNNYGSVNLEKMNFFSVVEYNGIYKYISYAHEILEHARNNDKSMLEIKILRLIDSLKFSVFFHPKHTFPDNLLRKILKFKYMSVPTFTSFGAFRPQVLENEKFDDLFINGGEDRDLAIRLKIGEYAYTNYPFKVKPMGGGGQSLNSFNGGLRSAKNVLNSLLLSYKVEKYLGK